MKCCKLKFFTIYLVLLSVSSIVFYLCNYQNPGWSRLNNISSKLQFVQYFRISRNHSNWSIVSGFDYAEERAGQLLRVTVLIAGLIRSA